ncbi:hypothetical protein OG21DRAFT_1278547 [Imleria badia]|nr:hypothetical protein OG21DRAFT_1278547 [Imleria badia]
MQSSRVASKRKRPLRKAREGRDRVTKKGRALARRQERSDLRMNKPRTGEHRHTQGFPRKRSKRSQAREDRLDRLVGT